jgi:hypothetical protein
MPKIEEAHAAVEAHPEYDELYLGLLEAYYLADAFFGDDDYKILKLIDDAICSKDITTMRKALAQAVAAMS